MNAFVLQMFEEIFTKETVWSWSPSFDATYEKKRKVTAEKLILKEMKGKKTMFTGCAVQWFSGRPELVFRGPYWKPLCAEIFLFVFFCFVSFLGELFDLVSVLVQ